MTKQGGKRKGAGRKPSPYKTKTVSFRIRIEWEEKIRETVKAKIIALTENCNCHS